MNHAASPPVGLLRFLYGALLAGLVVAAFCAHLWLDDRRRAELEACRALVEAP